MCQISYSVMCILLYILNFGCKTHMLCEGQVLRVKGCLKKFGLTLTCEIKCRQTGTLKCSKFFISLERFGLGQPLTTHCEGLIKANRLTFNLIQLNNTKMY